jgi:hypothetical protein
MFVHPAGPSCPSCGREKAVVDLFACTSCTDVAAHHARTAVMQDRGGDALHLQMDRWLLADAGLPVDDRSISSDEPGWSDRALAVHRARLIWLLAEELADLREQWDEAHAALSAHGLLEENDDLVDGIHRAVDISRSRER